ncbi:lycopene cyclase [Dokdonia pacifica]|uniref:Lycopene beta-cyclase n=1 Tax=Dokdonia pacifica TaxID=1627892 RepID=A0A238WAU3_9FLAO|nr:lycopene cyclase family protein [Dokdonia pacifica]GGG13503.1 lycopene cyclase [Dokdonia pacifica]SNR43618.1 lycopene beta-cyclase [Dokdonia pacifica]
MQTHYDYIILGGGLSGLTLAYRMAQDSFFDTKSILIIDQSAKEENDRTWCFWESQPDIFEDTVSHRWPIIGFKSPVFSDEIAIQPYTYKKIEGADFYAFAKAYLATKPHISFLQEHVTDIQEHTGKVTVTTTQQTLTADRVCNSFLQLTTLEKQSQHQYLKQHFIGWFIRTETPVFDPEVATFMDFTVPQKGNCRFMYVLPTSPTEALFEYTLFSKELLEDTEYETAIQKYLSNKGILQYSIEAKEQGDIPMSSYRFDKHNSKRIIHIGSAGGWTKASTGFTFKHTLKKTAILVDFLKTGKDLRAFSKRTRFWWYDLLLVDVLYRKNHLGAPIFGEMFKNNPTDRIFRFLDDETTFKEELQIIWSLPKKEFIKAVFSRLFRL